MPHALVTGTSGFIGGHLVRQLHENGHRVTCLVRPTSDRSQLKRFDPMFAIGDETDPASLKRAMDSVDVVYHLAGAPKCLNSRELERINVDGVRHVLCVWRPHLRESSSATLWMDSPTTIGCK